MLLRREPDNLKDKSAVAVVNDGEVVGHIPYNMSNIVSQFLRRDYKAYAEVTGDKVNRGAGYGNTVYLPILWTRTLRQKAPRSTSSTECKWTALDCWPDP